MGFSTRRFETCGEVFTASCDDRLLPALDSLIGPFRTSHHASHGLRLELGPEFVRCTPRFADGVAAARIWIQSVQHTKVMRVVLKASIVEAVSGALALCIARALSRAGGLLLHAAGYRTKGVVHVFAGKSGSGKSTLLKHASYDAALHDDRIGLLRCHGRWIACGVPLCQNDKRPGANEHGPVATVAIIRKNKPLSVRALPRNLALSSLCPHVIWPDRFLGSPQTVFASLLRLAAELELKEITFRKHDDVSRVL